MLTTTTIDANNPKTPQMRGSTVGVLKHRLFDSLLVSHFGGIVKESKYSDFEKSIYELTIQTPFREHVGDGGIIDGILLDSYTLAYVLGNTSFGNRPQSSITQRQKEEIKTFLKDMVLSMVEYDLEVLAYGILVKHELEYEYLNDVIRSNRFKLRTLLDLEWNQIEEDVYHRYNPGIFDAKRPYFQISAVCLGIMIALICCFGVVYEILRRKQLICAKTNAPVEHVYLTTKGLQTSI